MDYKEKFEDFLTKMQGLLDDANKKGHIIVRIEDLEKTFPELKESDLKAAAVDYAEWAIKQPKDYCINIIADYINGITEGFIAGANWQKEQMMKDAIEGKYDCDDNWSWIEFKGWVESTSKVGHNVKLIIIKED